MRIALYARVSTSEQHVDPQFFALRQYASARGLEVAEEFVDHGISGSKDRRPGLDALIAAARRHRFDVVAVLKLDRLGRSLHHLLTLLGQLEEMGVAFVSLDDAIDTSTAAGRLFMQMRGAFAEYELAMIRERTKDGIAAARRRGAAIGRPRRLLAMDLGRMRELLEAGHSDRAIGRELGCAASTIGREARRLGLRPAA